MSSEAQAASLWLVWQAVAPSWDVTALPANTRPTSGKANGKVQHKPETFRVKAAPFEM